MFKKAIISISLMALTTSSFAQESLIINAYNRLTTSLNDNWRYIVDPYENGYYNYRYEPFDQQENPAKAAFFLNSKPDNSSDLVEYNFDKMDTISVPGDWNTQKENLFYYEGTLWYKKSFDYVLTKKSNRVFVYFEASNYKTEVYFNGQKLGIHLGGFTPFNFEVTKLLKQTDNFLIVKVDNKRIKEGVPTLNTDWWNYGGLTREVKLVETSENFIQDYFIQLDPNDNRKIKGYVILNGVNVAHQNVQIHIPQLNIKKTLVTEKDGLVSFEIVSNNWK